MFSTKKTTKLRIFTQKLILWYKKFSSKKKTFKVALHYLLKFLILLDTIFNLNYVLTHNKYFVRPVINSKILQKIINKFIPEFKMH